MTQTSPRRVAADSGSSAVVRPALLDVRTDPNVPPIPPHATFEQARNAAEAMVKGDEDRRAVITEGIKTKAQESLTYLGK